MSELGWVHFLFSLVAIFAGAVVVLLPKGTRWHRSWGHLYGVSMIGVVATALAIYDLTGGWGPFHFAAVVSGLTLVAGMYTVLARRPRRTWLEAHAAWMSWSYIGLLCAAAAETLTRFVMPLAAPFLEREAMWGVFWASVGVGGFAVGAVGWWVVKTRLPDTIARTPETIRRERAALRAVGADSAESGVPGPEEAPAS